MTMIAGSNKVLTVSQSAPSEEVPGFGGLSDIFMKGTTSEPPAASDGFVFRSGDDSNVRVVIDKNDVDSAGRVKIAVDVYYV